jgi:hypothetical protein
MGKKTGLLRLKVAKISNGLFSTMLGAHGLSSGRMKV